MKRAVRITAMYQLLINYTSRFIMPIIWLFYHFFCINEVTFVHTCVRVCVCCALLFICVAHTLSFNEPSARMLNLFGIASPNTNRVYHLP
jgi:phosphoglycerol transferase MdoB-like AlkP superfamily enzyme